MKLSSPINLTFIARERFTVTVISYFSVFDPLFRVNAYLFATSSAMSSWIREGVPVCCISSVVSDSAAPWTVLNWKWYSGCLFVAMYMQASKVWILHQLSEPSRVLHSEPHLILVFSLHFKFKCAKRISCCLLKHCLLDTTLSFWFWWSLKYCAPDQFQGNTDAADGPHLDSIHCLPSSGRKSQPPWPGQPSTREVLVTGEMLYESG